MMRTFVKTRVFHPIVIGVAAAGIAVSALPEEGAWASEQLNYVALGDSYSSAAGNLPLDPTAPPSCLRSTVNYANDITRAIGANLTDVTGCPSAGTGPP